MSKPADVVVLYDQKTGQKIFASRQNVEAWRRKGCYDGEKKTHKIGTFFDLNPPAHAVARIGGESAQMTEDEIKALAEKEAQLLAKEAETEKRLAELEEQSKAMAESQKKLEELQAQAQAKMDEATKAVAGATGGKGK